MNNLIIDDISRTKIDLIEKVKFHIENAHTLFNSNNYALLICELNSNYLDEPKILNIKRNTFYNNLQLIDSKLPEIISYLIIYSKIYQTNKIIDLIEIIKKVNPINYNLEMEHPYYESKIQNFLLDCAVGMNPNEIWKGFNQETNGLILFNSKEFLENIFIYNKVEFQKYLLNNTRLEQTSTSEDKNNPGFALPQNTRPKPKPYKYGWVYEEDKKLFIKLNLQIRFL
jgi:hypothetical protein